MAPVTNPPGTGSCPPRDELVAFNFGNLAMEELEAVASHVATCTTCDTMVRELQQEEDSLIVRLRGCQGTNPAEKEKGCSDLEARVKGIELYCPSLMPTLSLEDTGDESPQIKLPERIGPYVILGQIGRGGMGVVYRARQEPVNRMVALKMILGGVHAGPETRARFRVEGEAIARLHHPNVIQIYDFGEHEGLPYFSMELAEGGSLASRLAHGRLAPREAGELVRALARAVQCAHDRRVIHRDLKPGNVLLSTDGNPKVNDFGLAKLLDVAGHTASEAVMGTPEYMSPEQAEGKTGAVGEAADIYALGAILYACLTGRPPFRAPTRNETLALVRSADPVSPSRLCQGLSPDLEAVCLKCLEKAPGGRYASAGALADDLERWLAGEPTLARPRRWPARIGRALRRHPRSLALVLALAGILAALYFLDPDRPVRDIRGRLAEGEKVTLIGPDARTRWFRVRAGEDSAHVGFTPDGSLSIQSWAMCLVEMVPDPQWESYRFKAMVRHEKSDQTCEIGLYVGDRAYPGPMADIHGFTYMSFNDVRDIRVQFFQIPEKVRKNNPPPKGNAVRLHPTVLTKGRGAGNHMGFHGGGVAGAIFPAAGIGGGPWRSCEVVVRRDNIQAFFEGRLVGVLTMNALLQQLRDGCKDMRKRYPEEPLLHAVPPEFHPRGGLGFYVLNGSAFFRDVFVEPLDEAK